MFGIQRSYKVDICISIGQNWKGKTRAVLWILFHFKRVSCSWSIILLREALNCEKKDFLWNHFIKWWPPPRPPFMKSLFIFFPTIFWSKKKMILKVVWRVLMGVLRVLEGCCRVFEVCLKGVWKNKIEVWNQSDPPPLTKWFHKKSFFSRMMASLNIYLAGKVFTPVLVFHVHVHNICVHSAMSQSGVWRDIGIISRPKKNGR